MKLPFLRARQHEDEPLVVSMTGARLGDSVLFAGSSRALLFPLAARTGLSGRLILLAPPQQASDLETAATKEGLLVEPVTEPPAGSGLDLAVVEAAGDWQSAIERVRPSVRPGGRVIVVAGKPRSGLMGAFRTSAGPAPDNEAIVAALRRAGWQLARPIGEKEGLRFVEAFA